MKKNFVTRLDETAMLFDEIYISGGRIGCQIRLRPDDFLQAAWKAEYADLTRD
jgi:Cys-tRNA(Pro)/Cys-tRNA(Cys) deacylase